VTALTTPRVDPPSNFPPVSISQIAREVAELFGVKPPQKAQQELPSIFRRLLSESPNVLESRSLENVPSTSNEERAISSNAAANADNS
jgi:hypothetical protein